MKRLILILLAFLCTSSHATDVSGPVSGTWTLPGSPYNVIGQINIPAGQELVIEPGVQVIFQGWYKFLIYGRLQAIGTVADTIVFTAPNTTVGWHGLRFYDNNTQPDSSRLVYCKITYGKSSSVNTAGEDKNGGAIFCSNSGKLRIEHCLIAHNRTGGVVGAEGQSWPIVTDGESVESGHGGAAYFLNSNIGIANTSFEFNFTGTAQGGEGGSGGIIGSQAGGDGGDGRSGNGGAIYIFNGTVALSNIECHANSTGGAFGGAGGYGENGGTYGGNVGGDGGMGLAGNGGAIYLNGGVLNLANIEFMSNRTGNAQGGQGGEGGNATWAWDGGAGGSGTAGSGGALFADNTASLIVSNVLFAGNSTGTGFGGNGGEGGEGVAMWGVPAYGGPGGDGGNGVGGNGAAISLGPGNLQLGSNTMSANQAGAGFPGFGGAGGPGNQWGASGPPGSSGQGINGTAILYVDPINSSTIANSIFWDNRGSIFAGNNQVSYSCIEGGYPGMGNISTDPIFVTTALGHYFLSQFAAGQPVQSPCVDAGDPNSGLIPGTTRTDSVMDAGIMDMGYHYLNFIGQPFIATWPQSLHFERTIGSGNPEPQSFLILNPYTGSLNYEISENADWLQIAPMSGGPITPQDPDTGMASVSISGLGAGTYEAAIEIVAPGSLNGSCILPITLVLGDALLSLSTDSLFFSASLGGPNPPSQVFTIDNRGFGFLQYSITENTDWLTVMPLSGGPVPPSAFETVSVESDTLPAGNYNSDIIITTPWGLGSPDTVHVLLMVGSPILSVLPDTLAFIDSVLQNPPPQMVVVSNFGQGIINYLVQDTISWLTVSPMSGSVPPDDTLQISLNIAGFPAGSYEADISIVAPGAMGGPQIVHISAQIVPYLSGTVEGVLPSGTYYVTSDIYVDDSDILIIEPGTNLLFQGPYQFIVSGFLQAIGTQVDSIGFAPDTGIQTWKGIELNYGAATLKFCWITGSNRSGLHVYCSDAMVSRCKIFSNSYIAVAPYEHWAYGGGIYCQSFFSSATVDSCIITNNSAVGEHAYGGGVFIATGSFLFRWCDINCNSAIAGVQNAQGGGIYIGYCDSRFEHCTFASNSATGVDAVGGGARCLGDSTQFVNCIFRGNYASGEGDSCDGLAFFDSRGVVINCIIADHDSGAMGFYEGSTVSANYNDFHNNGSNFDGLVPPALGIISQTNLNGDSCDVYHNIFLDPFFVDPDSGDYHLTAESPCIDAGDPDSPLDPDSTIADMGAFYFPHVVGIPEPPERFIPETFFLEGNHPNPFNPATTITFGLPAAAWVKVEVFDIAGRVVRAGLKPAPTDWFEAGVHKVTFDGSDLPSGIYLLRLRAGDFSAVKKLILLK